MKKKQVDASQVQLRIGPAFGVPTVDMELKELGRQAGLTVLALAEGHPVEPGIRKLPCRLVVRQSCGGDTLGI